MNPAHSLHRMQRLPRLTGAARRASPLALAMAFGCGWQVAGAHAQTAAALDGDLGAAVYLTQSVVRGQKDTVLALPYVYADKGRFFGRVDTFGVKTVPMGRGHLELALRLSFEGYKADVPQLAGVGDRRNPLPVGLGTFQETPWGGLFANVFHDTTSGGQLLEASWAGQFKAGRWTLYPQAGLERRSAAYVQHLYGINAAQSASSGLPVYTPGASTVPVLGLAADVPLGGHWVLGVQWRQRWLDAAVRNSPVVARSQQASGLVSVSYRFP